MANPNIGFGVVRIIFGFQKLDYALGCGRADKALAAVSEMITSLRGLRRTIRTDINMIAWVKEAKGGREDEAKSD